jgi:peptide/nickel transport system permease protein
MLKRLFGRKEKEYNSLSLSKLTWQRFKREKQGIISLIFICLLALIALLGYWITPDKTPYANHQQLEIALRPPGFSVQFLQQKRAYNIPEVSCLQKMLFGQNDQYQTIPIDSYSIRGDSLYAQLFEQESNEGKIVYHLSQLAENKPVISKTFLLGTDKYGRDVLSQLFIGSRISLAVGFIAVFIALLIGTLLGAIAGYFRGKIDDILMFVINVVWSIPTLLLVIAVSFALGKGFWQVFIAIGLTMWVDIARVVRGQVISLREQDFVEAGKALGFNHFYIIFKHILPNFLGSLIIISASNFSSAILMEAGLSFLGLGVQAPVPSWGMMIKENYAYIVLDKAYLALAPGMAIMLLVLSFMLIGSSLRNAMDVRR